MRIRMSVTAIVMSALLWSSSAMAQQRHVVAPSVMRQAVADQVLTDQQNRDVIAGVLHRSQVVEVASRLGLSATRADLAVSTLTSTELARLAGPARMADVQLAGGADPITMSLTTLLIIIIIVLLIAR